ncbi:hypothetical protein SRB5_26340 [Streptomyces sp. RB5]|uniref:Lantibiotic dehydratase N-terminal domain-containing protein n=1 Tax=Streptomyces smaragdinus TaxID=2585196 RepID=A0A7K0CG92_9ACTN|nr:lantibiotic dehydratase [Streptomyces smaragdinus]MQY12500.1 hypothetical protein [Streptomyces smaragdinus]
MTAVTEHTAAATGPDAPAAAEPLWYLRINPLCRTRLSDPGLRALLGGLHDAEGAVRGAARACEDELYGLIGATTDKDARRRLVDLRRVIHNDRAPKTSDVPVPSVARWLAARDERQRLRDGIAAGYEEAAERERATLAGLLGDENLRGALATTAPDLYADAERYRTLAGSGRPVPASARKSERGLLQFVTRAMVRTSPLSRFTAVGLCVPDPAGPPPQDVRFSDAVSFPTLDRVMLGYVVGGLYPPGDDVWVGLSPTSALEGGKLFFLQRTDTGFRRLAAPVAGRVALLLDAVVMGPRHIRDVAGDLAAALGCTPEEAAGTVAGAIRQGLLCTYHEPEDGNAPLDHMLTHPGTPAAGQLADVRARLSRMATAPPDERGRETAAISAALAETSRLAGRPGHVMVVEDYVIPPQPVATGSWHRRLGDLSAGVELLSVFDWMHDVRAVLTASFVDRFGPGANVPLVEHAGALVGEVMRRTAVLDAAFRAGPGSGLLDGVGPAGDCLERLYALRRSVTEEIGAGLTRAAGAGEPELALRADEAVELVAALPERFRRDRLSYGVLVQSAGDRLICNDGLPGYGMLYARFLDADRRLGGSAVSHVARRLEAQYGWDGSRVFEDLGLHRLNVNAHPPVLPDGLRPADWFALRLAHDPDTDTIHVEDADGRPSRVLPLGTGHPGLFPPPLSVAAGLVISGRLFNSLPGSWHTANPWDGKDTRVCPRTVVGDVVMSRRRWYGGSEFAGAVASPGEPDRLLALTAWRQRHGVPEEVVVKTPPQEEGPGAVGPPDAHARRLRQKPQYVDLTSALGVRVLPRMLARRGEDGAGDGGVEYLEEALPAVADGTYATEWVVEVERRPGGRFEYGGELS